MIRLLLLRKDRFLVLPLMGGSMDLWEDVHCAYRMDARILAGCVSTYSVSPKCTCNILLENNKITLRIEDVSDD